MKPNWRETGKQEVFGEATRMSLSSAACLNWARAVGTGGVVAKAACLPTWCWGFWGRKPPILPNNALMNGLGKESYGSF